MSYTINLTDGALFATIADGTINTSSSMILVGKNYAGYGAFLDTNFIHLLENASNTTPPSAPLTGQLWWNSGAGVLNIYSGTAWKVIGSATSSGTAPGGNVSVAGDLWYNSTNKQLNVYTGTTWLLVGPQSSASQGTTGAIAATITDNNVPGVDHVVLELYTANTIVGMVSKDSTFTPGASVPGGWGVQPISSGITLSTSVPNTALFNGTATTAQSLLGFSANAFMLTGNNTSTSGTLSVINNTGLFVGSNSDFNALVSGTNVTLKNQTSGGNLNVGVSVGGVPTTAIVANGASGAVGIPVGLTVGVANDFSATVSGNAVTLKNQTFNGNLNIGVNVGGVPTDVILVNGTTGVVSIPSLAYSPTSAFTNITVNNILNGLGNGQGNIGNTSSYFNTIFAKATSAQYADVAERFEADAEMLPGTVVELGGSAEITCSMQELSDKVFGVISTQAAYLMNSAAGTDATHPPIAMTGRVPVRVVGIVRKGDRLVSAGNGLARSATLGEATAFNVIGRALKDKLDSSEGTVEAIVTIK